MLEALYKKNETYNLITPPKTIIFGCNGYLGKAFLNEYRKYYKDNLGTIRKSSIPLLHEGIIHFDITQDDISFLDLKGYKEALILVSSSKSMADCELYRADSYKVNVTSVLKLAQQLSSRGIKPIVISSDIVFDGKIGNYLETDLKNPLNIYGSQKAEIEDKISQYTNNNYLVLRLSKVFSLIKNDNTMLDEMAMKLKKGLIIKEAYDRIFSPLLITDLIDVVIKIQQENFSGIVNIAGEEWWSRYDIAVALAKEMGINSSIVQRNNVDQLYLQFISPKNTSLNNKKLSNLVDVKFTPMKDCIKSTANNWME